MKKTYFSKLKGFGQLCMLTAGLFFSASVFAQDVTSGMILNYSFENMSGTIVPDASGTGNAGTLMGAAKDTLGYSGHGIYMGAKADYISLPAGINASMTSFTYTAWVKVNALKNATRFFDLGIGADATNNFLAFIPSYGADNGFMCLRYRPATGTAYNVLTTTKLPTGKWSHIALTYNYDAGTSSAAVTIYLNGAVVGTGTIPIDIAVALGATTTNNLGVSRWGQDVNGFGGIMDDVRFYSRSLTATDILTLNGLAELNTQHKNLTLGDLTAVKTNITLPLTAGTNGVTITWASTNKSVIDTLGNVTRPEKYDASVILTATLSQVVGDKVYTLTKAFPAKVMAMIPTPEQIAEWNFEGSSIAVENGAIKVTDKQSGFVGTCMNDAKIRTIGLPTTSQYNVLELGNGTGYFDMGTEIGKAVYSLSNYTMCGYFRIDADYAYLNSNGNFYWTFANSADADLDKNGYIIGSLKAQSQSVSTNYYNNGNQAAGPGTNAPLDGWHHFAFTQNGTTGTVFIDGVQVSQNTAMTNLPATALPKAGLSGTPFNWLGRSNYIKDVYLRKTLLYDFQLLSIPMSGDDLNFGLEVPATIDKLNAAYAENSNFIQPELQTEADNLTLGDLTSVSANLPLPTKGTLDNSIAILWKTSNNLVIDGSGAVTRPNYYPYNVTLTAVLSKNGQQVTKAFPATVLAKEGTAFNNDLLVKYDFSNVSNDTIVTDVAEKHFVGTAKNGAFIHTIGTAETGKFNVLALGDSIGYFDMGTEVGKVVTHLNDYTMSAYYRVDSAYAEITKAGNFLWAFSNSTKSATDQNGYIIGALNNQSVSITPGYYTAATGNQAVSFATAALLGGWHHFAYKQSGTSGTVYVDGMPMMTGEITNLASVALAKDNKLGTLYNWIGRSNFVGDVYLRKTLVHDFRIYRTALTDEQVQSTELDVANKITILNAAYAALHTSGLNTVKANQYKVVSANGLIKVLGVNGTEKVSVYDITGRQIKSSNPSEIRVNSGIYVVKVNGLVTKVFVK